MRTRVKLVNISLLVLLLCCFVHVSKGGRGLKIAHREPLRRRESSISRQIRHVFNMRVKECALNDAISYAHKGCAMQMPGITLKMPREDDVPISNGRLFHLDKIVQDHWFFSFGRKDNCFSLSFVHGQQ